jgi:hypothetical protein
MEHVKKFTVVDADNGREHRITVEEGPVPYTTRLTFGTAFSVTLQSEDAAALAQLLKQVSSDG